MKILVADDDQASRRLVAAFLKRADHDVVSVESGEEVLQAMFGPEPPSIVIIDWVMPGMSGPDVVTKLRNTQFRIRPYVILLSAKNDKASVAEGLDAGADDFLSKPFNPLEMLARVRVAERTLRVQIELQQHIDDLEALAQRYNLLGELIGRQRAPRDAGMRWMAPSPPSGFAGANAAREGLTRLRPDEIDALCQCAFTEIGLGELQSIPFTIRPSMAGGPSFLVWAGVVLADEKCWVDLLLEIDSTGAGAIHNTALHRRPSSPQETRRFLAEVHTIVTSAYRAALQARGADILTPGFSRAVERSGTQPPLTLPDDSVCRAYGFEDAVLTLTITRHPCPVLFKEPRELRAGEVVASDFPPPEIDAIPLVTRGTLMNERFMGKLIAHAQREGSRLGVAVFAPSPLAGRI